MAIENLMTFDEIQRTALIGVIVSVPLMAGITAAWFVMVKPIVDDMRRHIQDLRETVKALLPDKKDE